MGPTHACPHACNWQYFLKINVLVGPTRAGFHSYLAAADDTERNFMGTLYLCRRGKEFALLRWLPISCVVNEFVTTNSIVFLSGLFDPISFLAYHV